MAERVAGLQANILTISPKPTLLSQNIRQDIEVSEVPLTSNGIFSVISVKFPSNICMAIQTNE